MADTAAAAAAAAYKQTRAERCHVRFVLLTRCLNDIYDNQHGQWELFGKDLLYTFSELGNKHNAVRYDYEQSKIWLHQTAHEEKIKECIRQWDANAHKTALEFDAEQRRIDGSVALACEALDRRFVELLRRHPPYGYIFDALVATLEAAYPRARWHRLVSMPDNVIGDDVDFDGTPNVRRQLYIEINDTELYYDPEKCAVCVVASDNSGTAESLRDTWQRVRIEVQKRERERRPCIVVRQQ
jgi:hypothetical protein